MMMGLVPSISTLGILTAQNPGGEAGSAEENRKANADLMADLMASNYGAIPIEGSYGGPENSFLIPAISSGVAFSWCASPDCPAEVRFNFSFMFCSS